MAETVPLPRDTAIAERHRAHCAAMTRRRRRRPSTNDSMHNVEAAMSKPLPKIESDQTRDVLRDYQAEVKELADAVVPGRLRVAMRRHIIAIQRRLDEYDAQDDQ